MLKQSLQLKLGQSLTMTPQLQQAIRLLQMPTLELQAHLAEVLESNVMLEQEEPEAAEAVDFELGAHFTAAAPPTEEAGFTEPVEVEIVDQPWADRAGTGSDSSRSPLPRITICPARQSMSSSLNRATSTARSPSRSKVTNTA